MQRGPIPTILFLPSGEFIGETTDRVGRRSLVRDSLLRFLRIDGTKDTIQDAELIESPMQNIRQS